MKDKYSIDYISLILVIAIGDEYPHPAAPNSSFEMIPLIIVLNQINTKKQEKKIVVKYNNKLWV